MTDYLTLAEIKAYIWPTGATADTSDDDALTALITGVSRQIEGFCGRSFTTSDTNEARYFTAEDPEYLFLDDIISVSALNTDMDGDRTYEDTWGSTDYDLLPENAGTDTPYTYIQVAPLGVYSFPLQRKGVKITGKWGWPSVPAPIVEACKIQCGRVWNRRGAPFGVITNPVSGEMRLLRELDPDVQMLISPYKRYV